MPTKTLADLAPNIRNPRKVTGAKLAQLKKALERFGDLGGIVFNVQTGRLVGGHQRRSAMDQTAPIVRTAEYAVPTRTGTVAEGYIEVAGEAYRYREVSWDEATEKAANLAANKNAGEFDLAGVQEFIGELNAADFAIDLTMFDEAEVAAMQVPRSSETFEFDEALNKVGEGDQGDIRTITFTLSVDQHALVLESIARMKSLGPFVDTGNANSNGNALARLCELQRG